MSQILGSIVEFAAEFDAAGRILNVWTVDKSLLYRPIDEMLGRRLRDVIGETSYRPFRSLFPRIHRTGVPEDLEYTLELADGEHRFLARAIPVDVRDGSSRTIRLLVQDVTRLRNTEELSQKMEALLSHTQQIANVGSWEYDTERRTFLWSDQMYRLLATEPCQGTIPLEYACRLFYPEDRARVWQNVQALIETGRPMESVDRFLLPDGRLRFFFSRAIPLAGCDGKVSRIRGISQDVTDRKEAEEKLRKNEALLRQAEQVADFGSWVLQSEERAVTWSENLYRVLRLDPQSQSMPVGEFWSRVHPADAATVKKALALALHKGIEFEHELRYTLPSGAMRILSTRGMPIRDAYGEVTRVVGVTRDITDQQETQRARRESEQRYRLLVNSLKDYAIYTIDCDGYVTDWNLGAECITGFKSEEVLGRHFACFYPPEDVASEKPIRELQRALNDGGLEDEGWRVRADGSTFWADVSISSLRDETGNPRGFAVLTRDMTERKRTGEELRKRQTLLAQSEILSNMGSWEIDAVTRTVTWSAHYFSMLGLEAPPSPAPIEQFWSIVRFDDLAGAQKSVARAIERGQPIDRVDRYVSPSGQVRILHSRGIPVTDPLGRTLRLIGTTQDVTERRQREEELRRLSQQLLAVRDKEQRRVARDLHETAVQNMAAMKMLLGRVSDSIPKSSVRARKLVQSTAELADEVISQVRTISHLLHPPLLDEAGLPPALRWYARGFSERSGITTKVEMDENFGRIPRETELAVFRIVQEALTNVHRHSGSPDAIIRASHGVGYVRVEVEDHGRGMPPLSSGACFDTQLGVGTAGMRERVMQLNGQFEIRSAAGSGTTVCAHLPVPQAKLEADYENDELKEA